MPPATILQRRHASKAIDQEVGKLVRSPSLGRPGRVVGARELVVTALRTSFPAVCGTVQWKSCAPFLRQEGGRTGSGQETLQSHVALRATPIERRRTADTCTLSPSYPRLFLSFSTTLSHPEAQPTPSFAHPLYYQRFSYRGFHRRAPHSDQNR